MAFGDDDKGQTRSEYWLSKIYPLVESSGGATFYGSVTTANTTTNFKVDSLQGLGTDLLDDAYYCQIIQADGIAPEGEIQKVSAYDTSDGDITVGTAFTVAPEVGDYILILHESVVKLFLIADGVGAYPTSVVDNSIFAHMMAIGGDISDFDNSTDSLEAIGAAVAAISATSAGTLQVVSATIDLNQAAATYTLLTGTTQAVTLEKLTLRVPNVDISGGALTSISIHTDDVTPAVIFSVADGDLANLTQEANLGWTGALSIPVGTIIQLTIAGGAGGAACVCDVVTQYRANVTGGVLT